MLIIRRENPYLELKSVYKIWVFPETETLQAVCNYNKKVYSINDYDSFSHQNNITTNNEFVGFLLLPSSALDRPEKPVVNLKCLYLSILIK